jgi:N-carbamoyl-L-amino-acid hydrolase
MSTPEIDAAALQKRIDELSLITEAEPPVVTRVLFSDADLRGREFVRRLCEEAGLAVRVDAAGNMFARWVGSAPDAPAVGTGPTSMRFRTRENSTARVVGVLGGLAAIENASRSRASPDGDPSNVVFTARSDTFASAAWGHACWPGGFPSGKCAGWGSDGLSLDELRSRAGLSGPLESVAIAGGPLRAFIELHIEQGPNSNRENIPWVW